jgi:hypothetical protein
VVCVMFCHASSVRSGRDMRAGACAIVARDRYTATVFSRDDRDIRLSACAPPLAHALTSGSVRRMMGGPERR